MTITIYRSLNVKLGFSVGARQGKSLNEMNDWFNKPSSPLSLCFIGLQTDLREINSVSHYSTINVDFLQFQRYFTPQAELEQAFIYIIHKPTDFSHRLRSYGHWLETSKSANRNPVPCPNTKNHLLSLSELADRK